ncbi:MAG: hypothetical protein ACLPYS_10370 [Vulcanimicrobiaceae bacterium]
MAFGPRVGALVFAALASFATVAGAQTLLTLHVRVFYMTLDKTTVRVGETFHLTINAHVDQEVLELDNVTLPDLSGFEIAGDERRCSSTGRGTDCVEVLTLDATEPGLRTLGPTAMDAVEARNEKPSRFLTNSVSIKVLPATLLSNGLPPWLRDVLLSVLRQIALLVFALAAVLALVWALARRKPRAVIPATAVATPAPAPPPNGATWQSVVAALAGDPTRPRVVTVREALRKRVGARDEETLADLFARRAAGNDARLRGALLGIERASFCEDARLAEAVRDVLPLLEALDAPAGASTSA